MLCELRRVGSKRGGAQGGKGLVGGVLIISQEQSMLQLSHFAALTECLTCFSALIWHISQGKAGVGTEGSDLRGSVCDRQILLTVCVRKNTYNSDSVCASFFFFLPVICPVVGLRP